MIILLNNILCKQEKGSSLFNSVQYVYAVCNIYVNAHKINQNATSLLWR